MIELFDQDIRGIDRQSSKGNQLKWEKNKVWYKADYTGYEGLVEYVISQLLSYSNLDSHEYVTYVPEQIHYKSHVYNGVSSESFLEDEWQIITLERFFQNSFQRSLNKAIWTMEDTTERLLFLVEQVERLANLKNFGCYMNKILTLDAFFLNEDRHTHNLALLVNESGAFALCPIFDNGAGLLADTTLDYPLDGDIYQMIGEVKGKTISTSLEEQLDVSENLYGRNVVFHFTKKDIERILALDGSESAITIYPQEIRARVREILFQQMRKYSYLFD